MNPLRIVPFVLLPASLILAQPPAEFGARPPARDRIVTAPLVDSESDAAVAGERNLLVNGNFERGTRGWELIAFGKTGKMTIDAEELLEGKPTLRIENFQGDHSFVRQIVKGKPNTRYRLTAYIKTLNVQPVEGSGKEGAVVMIGMVTETSEPLQKTTPWTKVSVDFTPRDPNEIRVGPSLGTYARAVTGTAWFSGITLIELGSETR